MAVTARLRESPVGMGGARVDATEDQVGSAVGAKATVGMAMATVVGVLAGVVTAAVAVDLVVVDAAEATEVVVVARVVAEGWVGLAVEL